VYDPIVALPGWYPYPDIWYEGPALFHYMEKPPGSLGFTNSQQGYNGVLFLAAEFRAVTGHLRTPALGNFV